MSDAVNHQRQVALIGILGLITGGAGTAAVIVHGLDGLTLVALALLVAAGAFLSFPVPFGGSIPISYALLMALTELRDGPDFAAIAAGGIATILLIRGMGQNLAMASRLGTRLFLASGMGGLTNAALASSSWGDATGGLGRTLITGAVMLCTDAVVAHMVHARGGGPHYLPSLPVYLTLLCGGALIAVAYDEAGPWMATVALFPILITRFSFQRQVDAQDTFNQTVQALGVVPEVAGLAPLGHSERTAFYAARLATQLGFGPHEQDRIVLAARLHHLGAVSLDSSDAGARASTLDRRELAEHSAAVLREGGFPGEIADLVAEAAAGSLDAPSPSLEASVLRVSIAFDDIVGENASLGDQALAIIASRPKDAESRRAVAALLAVAASDPGVVRAAVEAGALFTEVAKGLDLEALVGSGHGGEILPFATRRA